MHFVGTVSGGIIVGAIMGFILQNFSRKFLEPVVGVVFSFTIPYMTYLIADFIGVSGVLAVVVNGLIGSQYLLKHHSSLRRIVGYATWDIFTILINCFVFILIGLQLRTLTSVMTDRQLFEYTGYSLLITAAMIGVRMIWVYARNAIPYLKALQDPNADTICPQILREAGLIGWSGMRGIVSLTAALALPLYLPDGQLLQGRNEIIVLTFMVILLSLLIPGFSLSYVIRLLKIHPHSEHHRVLRIRKELTKVAEKTIDQLHSVNSVSDDEHEFLKTYVKLQHKVLSSTTKKNAHNLVSVRSAVISEKRKKLFDLWENLEIDDRLLTQLEQELDLEETHLARAELK